MPITIVFELEALQTASFNGSTGRATQGLWLNHWKEVNPRIGELLKSSNQARPYSISPVLSKKSLKPIQSFRSSESALIFLSIYDGYRFLKTNQNPNNLSPVPSPIPSFEAITEHSWFPLFKEKYLEHSIEIANTNWKVVDISIQNSITFKEIFEIGKNNVQDKYKKWVFDFITPTSFKIYDKTLSPLPSPQLLFRYWLQEWNRWAPKDLRIEGFIEELFYLIQIAKIKNLNTSFQEYGLQKEIGFTGQITLQSGEFPKEFVPNLITLAHFAPYCGCGVHTTRGMGFCLMQEK